jgi:hypothetical protein
LQQAESQTGDEASQRIYLRFVVGIIFVEIVSVDASKV